MLGFLQISSTLSRRYSSRININTIGRWSSSTTATTRSNVVVVVDWEKRREQKNLPFLPIVRKYSIISKSGRRHNDVFRNNKYFSSTSSGDNSGKGNHDASDALDATPTKDVDDDNDAMEKLNFHADDDAQRYFLSSSISDDSSNGSGNSYYPPSATSASSSDAQQLPPSYIRDAVTGKWTNKTHAELSMKDKQLLNLDDDSKSEEVMKHLEKRWKEAAAVSSTADESTIDDGLGTLNLEHERLARRIQDIQLALGPIGRDPVYYSSTNNNTATSVTTSQHDIPLPLTPREYQALKTYAQKEYNIDPKDFSKVVSDGNTSSGGATATTASTFGSNSHKSKDDGIDDLIPHNTVSSGSDSNLLLAQSNKQYFDADLDLAYLNPKLHRRAYKDESGGGGGYEDPTVDDPLADILPSDLNPTRKVNRRYAQLLPKRLLHHNNLSLLRRYTTPGGKIMNRVQSRLGAKDQRKIAKLVKRARHLGLIPHLGQWKLEDHGYLYEGEMLDVQEKLTSSSGTTTTTTTNNVTMKKDGGTKASWEVELEQRGLWPLQDDTEIIKKYYDMEALLDHLGGPKGSKKRETLDQLLGGPGALV